MTQYTKRSICVCGHTKEDHWKSGCIKNKFIERDAHGIKGYDKGYPCNCTGFATK